MVADLQKEMVVLGNQKKDIDEMMAMGPLGLDDSRSTDQALLGSPADKNAANAAGLLEGSMEQKGKLQKQLMMKLLAQLKREESESNNEEKAASAATTARVPSSPSGRQGGLVPWWLFATLTALLVAYVYVTDRSTTVRAQLSPCRAEQQILIFVFCNPQNTTAISTPLVEQSGALGFLNYFAFRRLQSCLASHALLNRTAEERHSIDQFGYLTTTGFVARFNKNGVETFKADDRMGCLVPVWEAARLPEANSFVLKVFSTRGNNPSGAGKESLEDSETGSEKPKPQLGLHRFNAANVRSRHTYLAHQASVLHVDVPSDMEGGQLQVTHWGEHEERTQNATIHPAANQVSHIRGDALLAADPFFTKLEGASRRHTMILIEQYILPPRILSYTDDFALRSDGERFTLEYWPHVKVGMLTLFAMVMGVHLVDQLAETGLGNWRSNVVALSLAASVIMLSNWGPPGS